jgi:NTE family protein
MADAGEAGQVRRAYNFRDCKRTRRSFAVFRGNERTAVLLAAGAERVIAWETGVLAGLLDGGVDVRQASVIGGTSAGSLVAARLALGVDPRAEADRLAAHAAGPTAPVGGGAERVAEALRLWHATEGHLRRERRRRIAELANRVPTAAEDDYVAGIAGQLPTGAWPASLRLAAADARTGERVVLNAAAGVDVARGVAAARALPGLRPAVTVGQRRLIDAALGTATNADLLAHDVEAAVIVTTATEQPEPGTLDAELAAGLAAERTKLDQLGVRLTVVHATDEERAAMGDDMFSGARAAQSVGPGREHGRRVAATAGAIAQA